MKTNLLLRAATIVLILALALPTGVLAAPSNDDFAAATPILALPYSINADTAGATGETGEPINCVNTLPPQTVWFSYTPSTTATLTILLNYSSMVGIFTGSSVDSLAFIACAPWYYGQYSFTAQAGVTYYFQLSDYYGNGGTLPFLLELAPPPQVSVGYYPGDPTVYDTVYFNANVYDPAGIYGYTCTWAISDNTNSDQTNFYHQFASDGDYTVNLTCTTADGRSGTATQTIQVRTRDVSISGFSVPQVASSNQTKTINVNIKNNRYSDYVTVILVKGLPGGGQQQIGSLTIYVPARATKATTFKFSYTFTSTDATIGKVVFTATASIASGRDALPADNTATATTLVNR